MYAYLGSIQFTSLQSFNSLSYKEESTFAEFGKMQAAPTLQGTSYKASEYNISILLRSEFTNVENSLKDLRAARKSFEILPLIWGNGKLEGYFVITTMDVTATQQLPDGSICEAAVSISLKQYESKSLLEQQVSQRVARATAVGNVQPVVNVTANPPIPTMVVAAKVTQGSIQTLAIDKAAKEISNPQSTAERLARARDTITKQSEKIQKSMDDIRNAVNDSQQAFANFQSIIAIANTVKSTALSIYNAATNAAQTGNIGSINSVLQSNFSSLTQQTNQVITQTIIRLPNG